jgi:hypothetical protein
VITAISNLTEIVQAKTNVIFDTNETYAAEYESVALGYGDAEAAWAAVLDDYAGAWVTHTNKLYDNVGWVKGAGPVDDTWAAYLWLLQNHAAFRTSPTNFWVSPAGKTNLIGNVLVGSIGDYGPMQDVVDVGPTNWGADTPTNFPGTETPVNFSSYADFTAYYRLLVPKVDFIRQDNSEFPETGNGACHMVSKFTTSANLPDTATFDGPSLVDTGAGYGQGEADPDTFRIQVKGIPSGQSPKIRLQVSGSTPYSHEFTMVHGTAGGVSTYRTDEHIRLVSNSVDDGYLAHQTPLVKLGDTVTSTLVLGGADVCSKALCVGRPASESGANAIRTATSYFVVADYSDVAANADTAKTTERMTEAWCQAAAKFTSSSRTKTPVRNVIRVSGTASGNGAFGVKVDGVSVPAFGIAGPGRTSPHQIAEDIASGINAVIGAGSAQAFNTAPGFGTPLAHVVVKKGSSVTFTDLTETVPVTAITIPMFSITDTDVGFQDEEPCLAANCGDGNPGETIDVFIVKTLGTGQRGDAWTPNYCGGASDMRNTSFIVLTAGDAVADNPHTAAHEAGRFFLNYDALDSGAYNLMNGTSATDSITARKRLTPTQHQTSRTVGDGTLLKP